MLGGLKFLDAWTLWWGCGGVGVGVGWVCAGADEIDMGRAGFVDIVVRVETATQLSSGAAGYGRVHGKFSSGCIAYQLDAKFLQRPRLRALLPFSDHLHVALCELLATGRVVFCATCSSWATLGASLWSVADPLRLFASRVLGSALNTGADASCEPPPSVVDIAIIAG